MTSPGKDYGVIPTVDAEACNICNHPVTKAGYEYNCVRRCRCMMMGCVPKSNARPVVRIVDDQVATGSDPAAS